MPILNPELLSGRGIHLREVRGGEADRAFQERLHGSTRVEELDAAGFPEALRPAFIAQQSEAQDRHYRRVYPGADWWIFGEGNGDAGRVIVHAGADHLLVVDIALLPEHRGRGFGTQVLREVMRVATERRVSVRMSAFVGERALRLYRRLGFEERGGDGLRVGLEWRPVGICEE
jgi:ribosomal protein S18 acetylase RimI-like enzyme